MKLLLIALIIFYQKTVSPSLKNLLGVPVFCRFRPTCSQYAINMIGEKGAVKGTLLALKRISMCQPYGKAKAAF